MKKRDYHIRLYSAAMVLALVFVSYAQAFEMADSKLDLKQGKTQTFDVGNLYETVIAIRVNVVPETHKVLPDGAANCSKSLRVFPKIFRLEAKERQTVKFISRQAGYCRVVFDVDKDIPDQIALTETATINTKYKIGIPVVVQE